VAEVVFGCFDEPLDLPFGEIFAWPAALHGAMRLGVEKGVADPAIKGASNGVLPAIMFW
jgi:hypothetical protein